MVVNEELEARVRAALARAADSAGLLSGGDLVELLEVDADRVAIVRLAGPCASCPSTIPPLLMALERAIRDDVPEVRLVELAP
jgi:Fe-S cluster biogenesis protein NfuA